MFSAVLAGPERSDEFFKKWVETVKATVPPERLLIFEVKQGNVEESIKNLRHCIGKQCSGGNLINEVSS